MLRVLSAQSTVVAGAVQAGRPSPQRRLVILQAKRTVKTEAEVQLPELSPAQRADRAKGAILGALVADAATMGLHWNYDQQGILRKVRGESDGPLDLFKGLVLPDKSPLDLDAFRAEFFEPPTNPFYKYPSGAQSPYGDEAVALVRSMAKEGALVPERYAEDSYAYFKGYTGRLNGLSKQFIEGWEAGKRWPNCGVTGDAQAHSLVRVPAVVARYLGDSDMTQKVTDAVRVHQDSFVAIDFATAFAELLQRVIMGANVAQALKWGAFQKSPPLYDDQRVYVQLALGDAGMDAREVVSKYGISCSLPGPFAGPLAIAFANPTSFERCVRANIAGGGDSCSRAAVLGALLGAQGGVAGIPDSWKAKVTNYKEWEAAADKIVASAGRY